MTKREAQKARDFAIMYGGNPRHLKVPHVVLADYAKAEARIMWHIVHGTKTGRLSMNGGAMMASHKVKIGLWEYQVIYPPEVVNVWHYHVKDKSIPAVIQQNARSLPRALRRANVGAVVRELEASSPTGHSIAPNPWRCPKCGAKPPDGGLMMAMLDAAPLSGPSP